GRGPVATLLFQRGTGKTGDAIIAGSVSGKIRAMFDEWGKSAKEAKPSQPVEVIGLSGVPMAGDKFWVVQEEKLARQVAERQLDNLRAKERGGVRKISIEDLEKELKGGKKQLALIVKADTQGSLEAILQSLQKLNREEVEVSVIHSGVGGITETDVMLAAAGSSLIVGFNVKPDSKARRAAEEQNVELRTYSVIYELTEDMEKALRGMLPPTYEEEIIGVAEVRQTFKVPQVGVVAGVYVTEGEVGRNSRIRVVRDGTVVYESKVSSLRRFKDDVKSVSQGFECGVGIEGFQDLKVGDILEFINLKEIPA
ncbi:MAG: translation initiation factor IF-2, partial [Actinomycetota bacterium]|nr:translation initiation factor IF-2 [Actinomycetota bacterium]